MKLYTWEHKFTPMWNDINTKGGNLIVLKKIYNFNPSRILWRYLSVSLNHKINK